MMESWQFFLQKEGDYAWLPLETPQVEILEGRYQLIAHTPQSGSSVRVHIRHQYEQEDIPQENIQDSVRKTDLSGKLEILPSVYLGLGSWSIHCYPQVEPLDDAKNRSIPSSSHGLDIQVLSQDFDLFEEWNFEDSVAEQAPMYDGMPIPAALALADLNSSALDEQKDADLGAESPAIPPKLLESELNDPELVKANPAKLNASLARKEKENIEKEPAGNDLVRLPSFSAETPSAEFRLVSPGELPRPVTDQPRSSSAQALSPELPPFMPSVMMPSQAMIQIKQNQRRHALTKIQVIAAAVSAQPSSGQRSSVNSQERFHSKLSQLVGG